MDAGYIGQKIDEKYIQGDEDNYPGKAYVGRNDAWKKAVENHPGK
jgi:hypothetical protein